MRLILIAPEEVYEHEVDPSMEVQDLLALVEAEVSSSSCSLKRQADRQTGWAPARTSISTESGQKVTDGKKTLADYELKGETSTVFLQLE